MKKQLQFCLVLSLITFSIQGQPLESREKWTDNEKMIYQRQMDLCHYLQEHKGKISKDTLFKNFVYFDYILNDTDIQRKEKRLKTFDTLFYYFHHYIDSVGLANLDAKPIRFYQDKEIYKPFVSHLRDWREGVFAYYLKSNPEA